MSEKVNDKKKALTYAEKQEKRQLALDEQIEFLYPPIEPWDSPVSGIDLLKDITLAIDTHMVFADNNKYSKILALWILHTYCFRVWNNSPILFFRSPVKGCGKSTLASIMAKLCNRAELSQRSTAPALDRIAAYYDPTIITDNFDQLSKEYQASITSMYDVGWEIGGCRLVCNSNDASIVDRLPCFCPKIISGLNDLPATTKSRSIMILLQKAPTKQASSPTAKKYIELYIDLKRKITRWINDNKATLESMDEEALMADIKMDGRQVDIWTPLISISKCLGGDELEKEIKFFAVECAKENDEQSTNWKENVLINLKPFVLEYIEKNQQEEHIKMDILLRFLDKADVHLEYSDNNTPKPNSGRKLSKILEGFGLKSVIWINGKAVRGIKISELINIFKTYVGEKEAFIDNAPANDKEVF